MKPYCTTIDYKVSGNAGRDTELNVVIIIVECATRASMVSFMKEPVNPIDFHTCTRTESGTGEGIPTKVSPCQKAPLLVPTQILSRATKGKVTPNQKNKQSKQGRESQLKTKNSINLYLTLFPKRKLEPKGQHCLKEE